jgi:tetratricopeptide (TPR) repeat protein
MVALQPQLQPQSHHDFGALVRKIVQTNSGQHKPFEAFPAKSDSEKSWSRYKTLAEQACESGNYSQAEAMWLGALGLDLDEHDARLAYTLEKLGNHFFATRRFEQAEMFCRRAVEASLVSRGAQSRKTASCYGSLSAIFYVQHRFQEAEVLCEKMLLIYEYALGPDADEVGMAANNLAMICHSQYKFAEAKQHYARALQIRSLALGAAHPSVSAIRKNFENLLSHMAVSHRYNSQFEPLEEVA